MAQENQIEERPRRGRPRRVSDDVLRDQILTGAMNTFVEKGFAGATMSDIARRAHVSKRDLYRQFADKTELFTATIRSVSISMTVRPMRGTLCSISSRARACCCPI